MEKSKMTYIILKNLYDGKILSQRELGLNKNDYAEILGLLQEKKLISGVRIARLGKGEVQINNQHEEITVPGINYLMENTIPDQQYNMRVSIEEVSDGVELSTAVDVCGRTCRYKKIFHKPLKDIDIEAESFLLTAEGLKNERGK